MDELDVCLVLVPGITITRVHTLEAIDLRFPVTTPAKSSRVNTKQITCVSAIDRCVCGWIALFRAHVCMSVRGLHIYHRGLCVIGGDATCSIFQKSLDVEVLSRAQIFEFLILIRRLQADMALTGSLALSLVCVSSLTTSLCVPKSCAHARTSRSYIRTSLMM